MTNTPRALALLLAAALPALAACSKNGVQDLAGLAPAARVKFFNYGVNAPGVNFYANDVKMTAISSTTPGTESVLGTAYGSAASGGFYSSVAPGQYTFAGRIAAAADKDLAVASLPAAVEDGKAYSVYMSGPYDAAAKKVDAFVVEDAYPIPTDTSAAVVRFVNAVYNAAPLTLYAKNTTTGVEVAVGGAVAYKGGGAFVPVAGATYDLSARAAGASTGAATRAGVSLAGGRVYTVSARGDVAAAVAANRPALDNTANR